MLSLLLFCRTGSSNGIIGMLSVEARQRAYLNRFCRSTCFKLSRKSLGIGKCAEPSFQMPFNEEYSMLVVRVVQSPAQRRRDDPQAGSRST